MSKLQKQLNNNDRVKAERVTKEIVEKLGVISSESLDNPSIVFNEEATQYRTHTHSVNSHTHGSRRHIDFSPYRVPVSNNLPPMPAVGQMHYSTSNNCLYICDGVDWRRIPIQAQPRRHRRSFIDKFFTSIEEPKNYIIFVFAILVFAIIIKAIFK